LPFSELTNVFSVVYCTSTSADAAAIWLVADFTIASDVKIARLRS